MNNYQKSIIALYFLVLPVLVVYFLYVLVIQNRVKRCLAVYDDKEYTVKFEPIPTEWLSLPLSDFYMASSHRSYLPCGNNMDLVSYKSIVHNIKAGARFLHLDVWSDSKYTTDTSGKLVVAPGTSTNETRNITLMDYKGKALDFTKCCQLINQYAWLNNNYPLILYLDLHLLGVKELADKVADTILSIFGNRLINKKYGYQRYNIGEIVLSDALNQLIIIVSPYPNGGKLDELTNAVISPNNQMLNNIEIKYQNLAYGDATINDKSYLTAFNKKYMSRVVVQDYYNFYNFVSPKFDVYNMDFRKMFDLGCQFVCMNYQLDDVYMKDYLQFFAERSLVLKPEKLRFNKSDKKLPDVDNSKLSFGPREYEDKGWVKFKF